jgi:hypothetical protein
MKSARVSTFNRRRRGNVTGSAIFSLGFGCWSANLSVPKFYL